MILNPRSSRDALFDWLLDNRPSRAVKSPPSIPAWLQRTQGDAYRSVRLRLCPHCRAPILAGLDADICALSVRVDMTPINEMGEAIALLAGRRTYDLTGDGSGKRLYLREEEHIKNGRRSVVLPAHRCGQSLAAYIDDRPSEKRRIPEVPPF